MSATARVGRHCKPTGARFLTAKANPCCCALMKIMYLSWLILAALAATATRAVADITLAPLFHDGVVLQRDQPLTIWGQAAGAERVEVKFRNQTAAVITSADGRWRVTLKPERAATVGSDLVATGANT